LDQIFLFLQSLSMQSVGIYEAKTRFSALIELVEQGEEVRITRHGKEVVRMLPMRRKPVITDEQIAQELAHIAALQSTIRAAEATDSVASLRHRGRSQA
jgi:prevent-host-death family protein